MAAAMCKCLIVSTLLSSLLTVVEAKADETYSCKDGSTARWIASGDIFEVESKDGERMLLSNCGFLVKGDVYRLESDANMSCLDVLMTGKPFAQRFFDSTLYRDSVRYRVRKDEISCQSDRSPPEMLN
jgi:hypothetical protein